MNCAEFRESLFGQSTPETRLAQLLHATGCAGCRAEAQQTKQIGKAIRALPRHAVPGGLRERLTRVAAEEGSAAPRRLRFARNQVLVVAATLLILSAILYPILNLVRQKQASQEDAASATRCLVNLKDLGLNLLIYAHDYDEHLPAAEDWSAVLVPYLGQSEESSVFWCPEDADPAHWPSYAMAPSLARADLSSVKDWGRRAALYDAEADSSFARRHIASTGARGGNAAYLDGHSGFSRAAPLGVPGHLPAP